MLDILVAGNRKIPIFIDDDINIKINFNSIETLKKKSYWLAKVHQETIFIHDLIGVKLIEWLQTTQFIKCMKRSAWETSEGIILVGSIDNFLYSSQKSKRIFPFGGNDSIINTIIVR